MRNVLGIVTCVVFVVACERTGATPDRRGSGDAAPTASGTAPSPATAAGGDACAAIRARFDAAYAARTDACRADTDCACYAPVGGPHMGCGGVTDAATAKKLAAIEADFHAASCRWTHQCAAWACTPRCNAGRCQP